MQTEATEYLEVLAMHHFDSRASLEQTLKRYVHLYNQHLPQKALGHIAPIDAMKSWHTERPELFHRKPRNHPGPETYGPTSAIHRPTIPDEHDEPFVLNLADHPIVAHPVPP